MSQSPIRERFRLVTLSLVALLAVSSQALAQEEAVCAGPDDCGRLLQPRVLGPPLGLVGPLPVVLTALPDLEPLQAQLAQSAEAAATAAVAVDLAVDQRLVLPEDRDALLMVELTGSDDAETTRIPVSMAVVIDASGSMRGDKIDDARAAARRLVDRLEPGDVLTVISYNTEATTHLDRFEIGENRRDAHRAIRHIRARGNTCISCGLAAAYTALESAPAGHVRRVVMLSDGNANRGLTTGEALGDQAATANEVSHVPTSTIGLGSDYNEDLMTAISAGGTGQYYFLPEASAMRGILDRELEALASTVALDLVIEVHPEGDVVVGDTETAGAHRDGVDLIINLGQLSAGEQRRLLVPLTLPEGELGQVISTRVSYADVTGRSAVVEGAAEIGRTDDPELARSTVDSRVAELSGRLASVRDLETAMVEFNSGNRAEAQTRLRRRADELRVQADALGSAALADEAAAVEALAEELEEGEVDEDRGRELFLQNQARGAEVRSGAEPAQMYHQDTVR